MNHKSILSFMLFLVFAGLPAALLGQKEVSDSELTLRQQVDGELINLQRNIKLAFEPAEKFNHLDQALKVVKGLRKQSPVQLADDEIYLEKITSSLQSIPLIAKFKVSNCGSYRKQMNQLSKIKTVRRVQTLALNQALPVLESLCAPSINPSEILAQINSSPLGKESASR